MAIRIGSGALHSSHADSDMTQAKLKVLYCTMHNPCGPTYGSQLRTFHIASQLASFCEIGLALFPFTSPTPEERVKLENAFTYLGEFKFVPKPKRNPIDYFRQEFDKNWLYTHGQQIDSEDRARFLTLLSQYDYVWFLGIRIPNALGIYHWPRSVLDIDDIPSTFYSTQAKSSSSILGKARALRKYFQWTRRERVLEARFSRIAVCSGLDRGYLGGSERISTIPNGFEAPAQSLPPVGGSSFEIGFIGTCEYQPNRQGLEWFLSNCWQQIRLLNPKATLKLVGKMTEQYSSQKDGVFGLGWVEDADVEMAGWRIMIVPLHVGGGTRIKIAEAFSRKIPLVSTSLGAFGYTVSSGKELLIADEPEAFSTACAKLLGDADLANTLAHTAFQRFEEEWSWNAIRPKIRQTIDALHAESKMESNNLSADI